MPQVVAKFGTNPSTLDELGCVSSQNQAAKAFNVQLQAFCSKFKGQYPDANVTHVDIFTIKLDLIANYSKYGECKLRNLYVASSQFQLLNFCEYIFAGFKQPIMACCGYGGPPFNFDSRVSCGLTKILNGTEITAKGCNDSSVYVNWDGTHYTEAANQHVALQILTGNYSNTLLGDKTPFLL